MYRALLRIPNPLLEAASAMGLLRLVGSLKLQVSFAERSLLYRALWQKRPIILRSLLLEATPYSALLKSMCVRVCVCVCVRVCVTLVIGLLCKRDTNVGPYTSAKEPHMCVRTEPCTGFVYGVALVSRLLQIIDLF